jgi:hypothetical protein
MIRTKITLRGSLVEHGSTLLPHLLGGKTKRHVFWRFSDLSDGKRVVKVFATLFKSVLS